jgi:4-hydroxybenzoate polyprenyltransferase
VKPFKSLFILMRPTNLLIVALTMVITRYVVVLPMALKAGIGMTPQLTHVEFGLLILTAIMLTAAGNIINDYFDLRVDQINKPEKIIVGKRIKRRVAIVLHQLLNIVAVGLAIIVCSSNHFFWPLVIPVVVATLLWFYSPVLKKKWLVGNVVVAVCTALVPLWASIFDLKHMSSKYVDQWVQGEAFLDRIYLVILIICVSSFLLNLIREALKDAEDMQGDATGDYQTLPLVSGIHSTVRYAQGLLGVYLILMVYLAMRPVLQFESNQWHLIIFLILIIVPGLVSFVFISKCNEKVSFTRASSSVKWLMLLGLMAVIVLSRVTWY